MSCFFQSGGQDWPNKSRNIPVDWDLNENFSACTTDECDGLWLSNDTTANYVDTTNNWIHWIVSRGTNDKIAYNLSSISGGTGVSDTAWVFRNSTTWNAKADNAGNQQWFVLSSGNDTVDSETAQDGIGYMIADFAGDEDIRSVMADGTALPAGGGFWGAGNNFVKTLTTKYYFEVTRLSATIWKIIYDDNSDFSSPIQDSGSQTVANTIINTDFLSLVNENAGSTDGLTNSDTDTVQFISGVTVAP